MQAVLRNPLLQRLIFCLPLPGMRRPLRVIMHDHRVFLRSLFKHRLLAPSYGDASLAERMTLLPVENPSEPLLFLAQEALEQKRREMLWRRAFLRHQIPQPVQSALLVPSCGHSHFQCSFALKIVHNLVSVRPRPTDSFKGPLPRHFPRAPEVCNLVLLF